MKYLIYICFGFILFIIGCEDTKESEVQTQFSKTFDITNVDMGLCVEQLNDGGYIVLVGSDTMAFNGFYTTPLKYSLIKTDSEGEAEWTRNIFENGLIDGADWIPNSLMLTSDGKYLIQDLLRTGSKIFSSEGELIADTLGYGIYPTNDNGFVGFELNISIIWEPSFSIETQFLLKKYTDLGVEYWEKNIFDDLMIIDSNLQRLNSVYLFESQTRDLFLFGHTRFDNEESTEVNKPVLIKIDNDGNVLLAKIYYDENSLFSPQLITKDGDFIAYNNEGMLKISSSGNIDWRNQNLSGVVKETEDEGLILISRDDSSIFLTKTNHSGSVEWEKSFNSESHHNYESVDVSQTSDGGYIITSSSKVNGWNDDIILIKTDSNGDTIDSR